MSAPHLSLASLVRGLERYGEKYEVLEVFADDVEELYALNRGQKLPSALEARVSGNALAFTVDGKSYRLNVSESSGFVRLTRGADADGEGDFTMLGRVVGRAIGLAFGSKGEGWPGLIMGVLAGGVMDAQPPERAIAVRYDPHTHEWRAYGGPWWPDEHLDAPAGRRVLEAFAHHVREGRASAREQIEQARDRPCGLGVAIAGDARRLGRSSSSHGSSIAKTPWSLAASAAGLPTPRPSTAPAPVPRSTAITALASATAPRSTTVLRPAR